MPSPNNSPIYSRVHDCFSREKLSADVLVSPHREYTVTWEQSRDKVKWEVVEGSECKVNIGSRGYIESLPKLPSSCLRYLRICAIPIEKFGVSTASPKLSEPST